MTIEEATAIAVKIAKDGTGFEVRNDAYGSPIAIACGGWDILHLTDSARNNDCVQIIVDRLNEKGTI